MPNIRAWAATLLLLLFSRELFADSLTAAIDEVLKDANYKHSRWGILVVEQGTGRVVFEHNAEQFFIPASTTKTYTCASALKILGANHRFNTQIFARGPISDGTLAGDLILKASGDPTLGGRTRDDGTMAFVNDDHTYADSSSTIACLTTTDPLRGIKALAAQVKAAGIGRVDGDVLIDDRLFDRSVSSGSGPEIVTPIVVNDNVLDIVIEPASDRKSLATVRVVPENRFVRIDSQVQTTETGATSITVTRSAAYDITVRGVIPKSSSPAVRIVPVNDPADFARKLFIEALNAAGVSVRASRFSEPSAVLPEAKEYERLQEVGTFQSPPLSELVKVVLKVSHNLYASTLPMLFAAKNGQRTLAQGLAFERKALLDLGIDVEGLAFAGGAGGTRSDSTTPRATIQLLRAIATDPELASIHEGFPVLGVDGTLASSVPASSPARGKVRGKTGTLWYDDLLNGRAILRSKALAGSMTTEQGTQCHFAMFVNDVPLPAGVKPAREGRTLGKICELIYQHGK